MRANLKTRGQSILLFALGAVVFFAFLAFVIDFGRLFHTRQKLRNHCDATSLAGAQNLTNAAAAKAKATEYYADNVALTPAAINWQSDNGNTSFYRIGIDDVYVTTPYTDAKLTTAGVPPQNAIEVKACRFLRHHIGSLLGVPTARVCARAVAIISSPCGVDGQADQVIPIGYPITKPADFDSQTDSPWIDPFTWTVGQEYPINLQGDGVHGNQYHVALPRGTQGGSEYTDNWKFGAKGTYWVGQIVETEPGVKNGPTYDGISYRVDQCPAATWDNIPANCPRIITTLLVDTSIDDYKGRANVKVVGFAHWFILPYIKEGAPGDPVKTVRATYLNMELRDSNNGACNAPVFNIGMVALAE